MTRGEIWWADFGIPYGSETGFDRPILIIQSDSFNRSNINTTIIVPLTTNLRLADAPGNVFLDKEESGLPKDSVVNVSLTGNTLGPRITDKKSPVGAGHREAGSGGGVRRGQDVC